MKRIINRCLFLVIFLAHFTSEAADQQDREQHSKKLTLIGEAHSSPDGMKVCCEKMRDETRTEKINFFIERDEDRLQWAKEESILLKHDSEEGFLENFHKQHLPLLNEQLAGRIYSNIFRSLRLLQIGLLKNRFWLLKILKDFSSDPSVKIIPTDVNFTEVIKHESFTAKSKGFDRAFLNNLEMAKNGNQTFIDEIMKSDHALETRNLLITDKLERNIEENAINIAIFGLVHAAHLHNHLNRCIEIFPYKTNFPEEEVKKELIALKRNKQLHDSIKRFLKISALLSETT